MKSGYITPTDMVMWLNHPVTKYVIEEMQTARKNMVEDIAKKGSLSFNSVETTAMMTAYKTGFIEGLDEFLGQTHLNQKEDNERRT